MRKKGSVKANIFLLAVLVAITLLLVLFIQNFYVENKNAAILNLNAANDCLDMEFTISGVKRINTYIIFTINNDYNSAKIHTLKVKGITEETESHEILPGEIEEVVFRNVSTSSEISVTANGCEDYVVTKSIV
ncbi:hypothetical protein GOV05_00885 [Candidatus Woesearchaeota archaeon]|nr:hypothetical protein [Candidatus Woesearchaeota archaeon]